MSFKQKGQITENLTFRPIQLTFKKYEPINVTLSTDRRDAALKEFESLKNYLKSEISKERNSNNKLLNIRKIAAINLIEKILKDYNFDDRDESHYSFAFESSSRLKEKLRHSDYLKNLEKEYNNDHEGRKISSLDEINEYDVENLFRIIFRVDEIFSILQFYGFGTVVGTDNGDIGDI